MHMYLPAKGARNGTHVPQRPFYMELVARWRTSMASEWITVQMFNAKTREEFLPQLQTMESFSAAFRNTSAMLWIRAARLLNWISKGLLFVGVQILRRRSKITAKCQLERVLLLKRMQNQRAQVTKSQTISIQNCRKNLTKIKLPILYLFMQVLKKTKSNIASYFRSFSVCLLDYLENAAMFGWMGAM